MSRQKAMLSTLGACLLSLLTPALMGCLHSHIEYLDNDLPLVAPLESNLASGDEQDDPPTRVARVSGLSGPVSMQQGGLDAWTPVAANLPLKSGDALWSGPGGRAEVQIGPTGLRTSDATSLSLLRITDRFFQVALDQGTLLVHILPGAFPDSAEIDTPAGSVNFAEAGTYRMDMDPSLPMGSVTVRAGEARVTLNGEVVPVGPGEKILLTGGPEPSYLVERAPEADGFETWSQSRDRSAALSRSALKLGKDVMGAADLDSAGTWQVHPQYGDIWVPRVAKDWAPYRQGRWTWLEPWGWTWVDEALWGFAPSHYGRWANLAGTWAWVPRDPGAPAARPMYAPALVAFAGQAPGQRPQGRIPGGGVAWFPLGPGEPYVPAYPVSKAYLRKVNASVALPGQPLPYANLTVPGALTVVPRTTFTGFAPVGPAAIPMNGAKQFRNAPVGGAPALAPTAQSFLAAPAASRPPAGARTRLLVARSPMPALPVTFASRLPALEAAHGRPQGVQALRAGRPVRPWVNAVAPASAPRNRALPAPRSPQPLQRQAAPFATPPVPRQPERQAFRREAPRQRTQAPRAASRALAGQGRAGRARGSGGSGSGKARKGGNGRLR